MARRLGSRRVMVVHGEDHLDEITGTGKTRISELRDGEITTYSLDPTLYIGDTCAPEDLRGGTASENAAITRDILSGTPGPRADVALLNGAAAIYVGLDLDNFSEAMTQARESVASGKSMEKLEQLIERTN